MDARFTHYTGRVKVLGFTVMKLLNSTELHLENSVVHLE